MHPLTVFVAAALVVIGSLWLIGRRRLRRAQQAEFIRGYVFPPGLMSKLMQRRPGLSPKNAQLVSRGLRQFFLAHHASGRRFVSMPSQVVDDLWHEFILYTKHYDAFCRQAFGQFMHHTPAVVLSKGQTDNTGLRRCWWFCCKDENIDPRRPSRLPLLFALDAKLGIADGFHYTADCEALRRKGLTGNVHCGGDFSSDSFDGGTAGFDDSPSSSDGGGSDGSSSDGGSGCGGGGCGGGGD